MPDQRSLFTLLGFVPILIWGTAVGIAGSVSVTVGLFTAPGLVLTLAGAVGAAVSALRGGFRPKLRNLRRVSLCGLFFALNITTFWLGTGSAPDPSLLPELGLVNYLWPTFTLLLSLLLPGRRARPLFFAGVALAAIGVALPMAGSGDVGLHTFGAHAFAHPVPYLLMLSAALSWGIYSNLTKLWADTIDSSHIILYLLVTGALLLAFGWYAGEVPQWNSTNISELVLFGTADAAAYVLWDVGMRRGDQVVVASASYFTPLLSTIFTCLYFGLSGSWNLWVGCAMVMAGAVVTRLGSCEDERR